MVPHTEKDRLTYLLLYIGTIGRADMRQCSAMLDLEQKQQNFIYDALFHWKPTELR